MGTWINILFLFLVLFCHGSAASLPHACPTTNQSITELSTTHEIGALGPYYEAATGFLNAVSQGREINVEHVRSAVDYLRNTTIVTFDGIFAVAKPLISDQAVFVGLLIIGFIYAILFPIFGLVFCLCRMFGCCGGKRYEYGETSNWLCGLMSVMLALCAVVFASSTVLYGFTNHRLYNELETTPTEFNGQLSSVAEYITGLTDTLTCSIRTSYQKAHDDILTENTNLTKRFSELIKHESGLNELRDMETAYEEMNGLVEQLDEKISDLCSNSNDLNDRIPTFIGTSNVSARLEEPVNLLGIQQELGFYCELKRQPLLNTTTNFTLNTEPYMDDIDRETDSMQQKIDEGLEQINYANKTIESTIERIDKMTKEIVDIVKDVRGTVNSSVVETMKDFSSKYSYLENVGLLLVLPTALITLCLVVGLACGLCGSSRDRNCCSEAGGCCLMGAVGLIFLFSWLIMLITMAVFTVGYLGETQVCRPLFKEPNPAVLDLMPNVSVETGSGSVTVNFAQILEGCKMDQPIYDVLNLKSAIDLDRLLQEVHSKLDNVTSQFNIAAELFAISSIVYPVNESSIHFLSEQLNETERPLHELINRLHKPTVTINELTRIVVALNESAENGSSEFLETAQDLLNRSYTLENGVESTVDLATNISNSRQNIRRMIEEGILPKLANGTKGIVEAVSREIDELQKNLTGPVRELLTTVNRTVREAGTCGPLYSVYQNVGFLFCQRILYPLQGVWASLGLFLVLFIPAVICGIKLATYFRQQGSQSSYSNGRVADQGRWSTSNLEMTTRKAW